MGSAPSTEYENLPIKPKGSTFIPEASFKGDFWEMKVKPDLKKPSVPGFREPIPSAFGFSLNFKF